MHTTIISAFPGTGKSWYFKNSTGEQLVLDSDSSRFNKNDFPANYLRHINAHLGRVNIILVSSHRVVREALQQEGIAYIAVFPGDYAGAKEEYLQRYKDRKSPETFIKLLDTKWEEFMEAMPGEQRKTLSAGEYLADLLASESALTDSIP